MIANVVPTDKWSKARSGCVTSSEVAVLFTEPRSKAAKELGEFSEGAKTYLKEKATELITGTVRVFDTYATDWGKSMEPRAVDLLRSIYPGLVYHGGTDKDGNDARWFCKYIGYSGGSPDASHREMKLVAEIKCPENPAFHLDYLLLETGDDLKDWNKDYWYQVQMNGLVVATHWGIPFDEMNLRFASYGDLFPDNLKLKVIEVAPDLDFAISLNGKLERAFDYIRDIRAKIIDRL